MPSSSLDVFNQCTKKLEVLYSKQEAQSISFLLLENLFSLSKTEVLIEKEIELTNSTLDSYLTRLMQAEPLQYVLGTTHFYGYPFNVNPSVLIPRFETEELVQLICNENKNATSISIVDIGTGSGCIAITLKKELPQATVTAIDISKAALQIAESNAVLNGVTISFVLADILSAQITLPPSSIIVSNPPYILPSEKIQMHKNVLAFEPHLALFVEENNPLVFYSAIAKKAFQSLTPGGKLYFEINEQFGKETSEVMKIEGFSSVQIIKDLNGKERIIKGLKK